VDLDNIIKIQMPSYLMNIGGSSQFKTALIFPTISVGNSSKARQIKKKNHHIMQKYFHKKYDFTIYQ